MGRFVDGMIAPINSSLKDEYLERVKFEGELFKKHGALSVMECWGVDVPEGELTSMPKAVQLQPGETVLLSWIVWPDKATRDAGMEAVMNDPDMGGDTMLFDGKRLIFGGFDVLLES